MADPREGSCDERSREKHRGGEGEMWDGWEYMRAKKRKLREQFAEIDQEQTSDIFAGVTVYVNGWTQPSADELKRLIHAHGGSYEYNPYGDSCITHTIATNLPHAKIRNLKGECVCTPEWIVDSVAAGRRLPVESYLLYSRQPKDQKTLQFSAEKPNERAADKDDEKLNGAGVREYHDASLEASPTDPLERLIPQAKPGTARQFNATRGAAFVSDYYTYSRLHYLSTWITELKQFTSQNLPQVVQKYPKLPAESSLRASRERLIAHVDVDCFFVSVSVRDRPYLKGKPVAVCHAKRPETNTRGQLEAEPAVENELDTEKPISGVDGTYSDVSEPSRGAVVPQYLLRSMSDIASCNYEARSAGLHNGMFVGKALKQCPDLQLVPYEFDKYHEVSKMFYKVLMSYSACIEPVSCDEAYLELTDYVGSMEEAERIVQEMRDEVRDTTGCTVSAGAAQNMLLARMATRVAKPDGQHFISAENVADFLHRQRVQDLPGVGYSTTLKLREMGVETCGQLRELPLSRIKSSFGSKTGQMLFNYCRGTDDRQLKLTSERKSISVDLNYGLRFKSHSDTEALLDNLTRELERRAVEASVIGGTLTLKLMIRKPDAPTETSKYLGHGRCNNVSRSCHLLQPTADAAELCRLAVRLLKQIQPQPEDIRGVGLQLTRLASPTSPSLSRGGHQDLRSLLAPATASKPPPRGPQSMCSGKHGDVLPPFPDLAVTSHPQPSSPPLSSAAEEFTTASSNLDDTFALNLPPASQLDSSVLDALPAELADKILRSYTTKREDPNSAIALPFSTVGKLSSLRPAGRSSEEGRRTRGRGRGRGRGAASPIKSPHKQSRVTDSPNKQKLLFELLLENYKVTVAEKTDKVLDPPLLPSLLSHPLPLSDSNHTVPTASSLPIEKEQASIATSCEVTHPDSHEQYLQELRASVKEWVGSWPAGPQESDLEKMAARFTKLCYTDPTCVFIVLCGFRRLTAQKGVTNWSTAFNSLLRSVQSCVHSLHRATLPIEPI